MFRRFEATIGLNRLVTIKFNSYRNRSAGEIWTLTGIPWKNLEAVIYLKVGIDTLQGVPKNYVISIEGAHMPAQEAQPVRPPTLPLDDPKFTRFQTAILLEERVRIEYLLQVKPDPAIQNSTINEYGLPTITEGRAAGLGPTEVEIFLLTPTGDLARTEADATKLLRSVLPRDKIVDIKFLGPRPVPAEEMV